MNLPFNNHVDDIRLVLKQNNCTLEDYIFDCKDLSETLFIRNKSTQNLFSLSISDIKKKLNEDGDPITTIKFLFINSDKNKDKKEILIKLKDNSFFNADDYFLPYMIGTAVAQYLGVVDDMFLE